MSFYLDDHPEDEPSSLQLCPNCSGTSFYNDQVTGALTCSSCYTQSQTATQEELDIDEGLGLAARSGGKRTRTSQLGKRSGETNRGGVEARDLSEYDRSKKLPDAESCCLAFQWLLWDASKRVAKLAGIQDGDTNGGYHPDGSDDAQHTIMERTVKKIWFAYLGAWMEATKVFSTKYPEMRVSFRDCFLENAMKMVIARHLSVTVGKKVEDEMLKDIQHFRSDRRNKTNDDDKSTSSWKSDNVSSAKSDDQSVIDDDDDDEVSRSSSKRKRAKMDRRPILSIPELCKRVFPKKFHRFPNGAYHIHPHHATLKIQPSPTLLLSILQLALTHLQAGVAPYHLTTWVANGLLPHALNGYALLPSKLKERVVVVKNFFARSCIPPANDVADLTELLAASCNWYSGAKTSGNETNHSAAGKDASSVAVSDSSRKCTVEQDDLNDSSSAHGKLAGNEELVSSFQQTNQSSRYNVPLLAARMVRDLGFEQQVLDNALCLMGITHRTDADETRKVPPPLEIASASQQYSPLHVAAVIAVACKLCVGWESWTITNLHAKISRKAFLVPWNESQLQLLGNGKTLEHYIGFLEDVVINGVERNNQVTQFFQSLGRDLDSRPRQRQSSSDAVNVKPNTTLSGHPNPNESSNAEIMHHWNTNNIHCYTSYQHNKHDKKASPLEPYHPNYCRLIEYICYIVEEKNPGKLHDLVQLVEEELLRRHRKIIHPNA
ncbi:predicted protein [Thalassiosira pseudonana CCMP1335]|uniref:Uncharacterized protein n=1 Tax=Thalassiosira pseudonana TaxID=35128 RepID=B8BRS4_THAPS|nr:predicted protein [Thalassiosira pseudonana CCMP1335]EED96006.1 predicted protein [Thalassiosira pseudonana CCMP1335]